jgi:hypothetical protein
MDRTVNALQHRLVGESDQGVDLVMHFPPAWDRYFQPIMGVLNVYHYGIQHFDHHQQQLTVPEPPFAR